MNKMFIRFNICGLLIGVMTIVSSCGVYSKYEREQMHFVDSLYRRMDTSGMDSISTAAVSWDQIFTDAILQEWIKLGLEYNTDLMVAEMKVVESQANLMAARRALLPNASFAASGGVYPGSFNAQINSAWNADIFGSLRNSRRKAEAALQQTEAYKDHVKTQLVATIANSYYMLLMLDEQLNISRRTLKTWDENIRAMEALKRAGKTNEAAVLQAKANKLKIESSIYTMEHTIQTVENEFAALLGMVPMKIKRGNLENQTFPTELSEGVPVQLLARRPDIRKAEQVLIQKYYLTNAARAYFYPNLTLSGSLGWTNGSGAMVVNPAGLIAGVLGSLTQPIFGRGVNKARLASAKAEQEIALYNFRQTILDAGINVNDAISKWQTAQTKK